MFGYGPHVEDGCRSVARVGASELDHHGPIILSIIANQFMKFIKIWNFPRDEFFMDVSVFVFGSMFLDNKIINLFPEFPAENGWHIAARSTIPHCHADRIRLLD